MGAGPHHHTVDWQMGKHAPLDGFHRCIGAAAGAVLVQSGEALVNCNIGSDLDLRADISNLLHEHNRLVEEARRVKDQIDDKVSTHLDDVEHEFEGVVTICETLNRTTEIWDVHNILSDVHHRSMIDLTRPPSEWKTLCGWPYAGKSHARTNRNVQIPAGHKSCPRCYPSAESDTSSEPSSSSTQD